MADVKEWGARFNFPENLKIEYDGYGGGISNQIAVKIAEMISLFRRLPWRQEPKEFPT